MHLRTNHFLNCDRQQEIKQVEYNFLYFAGIFVAVAFFLLLLVCTAELMSNNQGAQFFKLGVGVFLISCICIFILIVIYTHKHSYWGVLFAGMTCDAVGMTFMCVVLLLCIYASPAARGFIFTLASLLSPMQDLGRLHAGSNVLPSLVVNDTSIRDGYATLTTFAQQTILNHQTSCTGRTFIVAKFSGMGMAALMHYYGVVLARALNEDKIFAWGDAACADFFGGNCRGLFLDEHTCLVTRDAIAEVVTDVTQLNGVPVPRVFADVLTELHPSMTGLQLRYWWRTQSVTYLMRFNPQTQAAINTMRADPAVHPVLGGVIPAQTINIQMRRGDKFDEMGIPPVQKYIARAEQLFNDMPFSYSRWVFITGDELESLEYAAQLAREKNWGAIYSIFPRMGKGFVMSKIKEFGWTINVTIANLMDLDMSKECSAWLGTRTSGWSRLFDEFRCTRVPKCQNIYIEIGSLPSGKYSLVEI